MTKLNWCAVFAQDVGWAESAKAHQNPFAVSHDAHRSQWKAESGGPASLGPPYQSVCNAPGTVRRRHGYTLLELLIVLAILAAIVGLAWPAVHRLSETGRLQDAARQLRIQLLEARLDAIESGSVRFFRYQPGTSAYEVASSSDFATGDQLGLITPSDAVNDSGPSNRDLNDDTSSQRELPDEIVFFDPNAGAAIEFAGDLAGAGAGEAWSAPIVFYPNGRTLNAHLRLGTPNYAVDLTLRGLTGSVTVGEVQRLETMDGERLGDL